MRWTAIPPGIDSLKGTGNPLGAHIRNYFESRFGTNFNDVRFHTASNANRLAAAINARAFTFGKDIAFGKGEFQPETNEGKKLLAHELVHTIQQGGGFQGKGDVKRDPLMEYSHRSVDYYGYPFPEVNLRLTPDSSTTPLRLLTYKTRLHILQELEGGWYYITTDEGTSGYVTAHLVNTDLPEPNAELYQIQNDESAYSIANNRYSEYIQWGQDTRYFVNVLVYVNMGDIYTSRGIYKRDANDPWSETIVQRGAFIWLPSPEVALLLKNSVNSGSISFSVISNVLAVLDVIKQIAVGTSNVIVGICAGFADSNSFGISHNVLYDGLASYAAYPNLFRIGFAAGAMAAAAQGIIVITYDDFPKITEMNFPVL